MIDRDLLLILVGGLIGAASSIGTLIVSYMLEGMRLRRHWQREDQLLLRQKRNELQDFLAKAGQQEKTDE